MYKLPLVVLLLCVLSAPTLGKLVGTQCRQALPKHCVFPKMCDCPEPYGGYLRIENRWRYDNTTKSCVKFTGSDEDCNNFESQLSCQMHCDKKNLPEEYKYLAE
uniref:Putative der and-96 secreted protein n=1 Tax=Rhipicephalus pulchellus TaxID=72859 RepID=L7LXR8_RHIPC